MVNKKFWLVILVIILIFGMTIVSCDSSSTNVDKEQHNITITGLSGKTGNFLILLYSYLDASGTGVVAHAQGTISGNSIIASLEGIDDTPWTNNGNYYIMLYIGNYETYIYTNSLTLAQLGIQSVNDLYTKIPKYNITGAATTIAFSAFCDVTGI